MTKRLGLWITLDELEALESICSKYEISKADWVRMQIRLWHTFDQIDKALDAGEQTFKGDFEGFGYQIDMHRIRHLISEGGEGFQKLIEEPTKYINFLQVCSTPRKRLRKNVVRRKKAA